MSFFTEKKIRYLSFSEELNYNVSSERVKTWVQNELSIGWFAGEILQQKCKKIRTRMDQQFENVFNCFAGNKTSGLFIFHYIIFFSKLVSCLVPPSLDNFFKQKIPPFFSPPIGQLQIENPSRGEPNFSKKKKTLSPFKQNKKTLPDETLPYVQQFTQDPEKNSTHHLGTFQNQRYHPFTTWRQQHFQIQRVFDIFKAEKFKKQGIRDTLIHILVGKKTIEKKIL